MTKQTIFRYVSVLLSAGLLYLGGCSSSGAKGIGEAGCDQPSECAGNLCVALVDGTNPSIYCSQLCDASRTCPSGFYCDAQTFGVTGISFCRFGATQPSQPEPPKEAPRLQCKVDKDCQSGEVCATADGGRDCTIPCSKAADCEFTAGGFTFTFATCAADKTAGVSRMVCLPNPACYQNPQSCIKSSGGGGGAPGSPCNGNTDCASSSCSSQGGFKICD